MVLIHLKAPGSARWVDDTYIPKSGEIIGYVDSQNSYGALLRSVYACTLDGVITRSARVFAK